MGERNFLKRVINIAKPIDVIKKEIHAELKCIVFCSKSDSTYLFISAASKP